jgi:anti-anti-sigma factor
MAMRQARKGVLGVNAAVRDVRVRCEPRRDMGESVVLEQPFKLIRGADRSGVAQLCLVGEFDLDNQDALLQFLRDTINDPAVRRIMVDLSGTTFMDSSGIRALQTGHAQAEAAGKQLRGRNPHPNVRRVFEILGILDLISDEP